MVLGTNSIFNFTGDTTIVSVIKTPIAIPAASHAVIGNGFNKSFALYVRNSATFSAASRIIYADNTQTSVTLTANPVWTYPSKRILIARSTLANKKLDLIAGVNTSSTTGQSGGLTKNFTSFYIGRSDDLDYFNGGISDIIIFNRSLSDVEIALINQSL